MSNVNRRNFLFGSLAAPLFVRGADETISTGFIGTGNRGSYLLRTVLDQPGVKVAAVCDIKPDRYSSPHPAISTSRWRLPL
jgi:predicted homoserine dehydrogenase-like protein